MKFLFFIWDSINFLSVSESITVGIAIERISLVFIDFRTISKSITIGVFFRRVGVIDINFFPVGNAILICIDLVGVYFQGFLGENIFFETIEIRS